MENMKLNELDLDFFTSLGFISESDNILIKQLDSIVFKLDFSNLPIIKLTCNIDNDSKEYVWEFEDESECKEFVSNEILGNSVEKTSSDEEEDEKDVEEEEDIQEDVKSPRIDRAKLEAAINKAINIKEDLDTANRQANEIRQEAEDEAQKILAQAQEEENMKQKELDEKARTNTVTSNIKSLIQDEWNTIEQYQSAISIIQANCNEEEANPIIEILNDIIEEEMVHVGQLNKAMKYTIPGFEEASMKGEKEAEDQINDISMDDIDDEIDNVTIEDEESIDDEPFPIEDPDDIEELKDDKVALEKEVQKDPENSLDDDEPLPVDVDDSDLM